MRPVRRLTILGLGLIGGSFAAALKQRGLVEEVVGWGRRAASLQRGLELGVIDRYCLDLATAVAGADLVVVATPTVVAEQVLTDLAAVLPDDALITDVASVKGNVARAAEAGLGGALPRFVPAHPIAGSERSGVEATRADLFVDHRVILTPLAQTDAGALERVRQLWRATGAEVVDMGVAEHDAVLAATSHLPHLLAFGLVDALAAGPRGEAVFRYAAGGFRDFTRIASSDPTMWRDIALANRTALVQAMDDFIAHFTQLRGAVDRADSAAITAAFERAKSARDRFADQFVKSPTTSQE